MRLTELDEIVRLAQLAGTHAEILAEVEGLPIHAFRFGSRDRTVPAVLVVGGVHGIERIGTDVATAYLTTLLARLAWDRLLAHSLEYCRILVVPLLNPVGMSRGQRANGNGVDLMRNAPASDDHVATPLLGGQRISARLPWYAGSGWEPESRALVDLVERELFDARCAIAVDLHSGFGTIDRLWYPYARTREPIADLCAIESLTALLDDTLPNHIYRIEQTAQAYTIRGDLWDYLYDRRRAAGAGLLVPLTLEMGSWAWVRKNPLQGLTNAGRFNPLAPHRHRRILRRHLPLLDFLFHAAASHAAWLSDG